MPVRTRTIVSGLDHPEGVAWDPAGFLVCGGEAGQIYRVDVGGTHASAKEVASTGGFALGIALDGDGRAYVCDVGLGKVMRVDPTVGTVECYSGGAEEEPMVAPNHLVFDRSGRLYVSDSGEWGATNGKIWVIEPGGEATVVDRESNRFPNGLAIDPAGKYLYVVESTLPGIVRHELRTDARNLGPREVVLTLPETVPDGLAFTHDGRLVITCYRPDRVYLWDLGQLEVLVEDWSAVDISGPTNAAFFGPALDRLAIANLGDMFLTEAHVDLVGANLERPRNLP